MLLIHRSIYLCSGLVQSLGHKVKERELARVAAVLVHEATRQVTAKDGPQIILRHPSKNGLKADLVQQQLRKRITQHRPAKLHVVPQFGLLQLFIQLGDGQTESVTQYT